MALAPRQPERLRAQRVSARARTHGPRLVVLGAGTSLPRADRGPAGYALIDGAGRVVLLDAGPGTLRALGGLGLGLADLDGIVFSHWHADHCADLIHLLFALKNPALSTAHSVRLLGPHGLEDKLALTQRWLGRTDEDGGAIPSERVSAHEVDPLAAGLRTTLANLVLEHRATRHTSTSVAWRVRLPNGFELCYSGDCGPEDPQRPLESGHADLAALARRCDLLIVDCSAPDRAPLPGHFTPASVARVVLEAEPERVLLTHTYPSLPPHEALGAVRAHLPPAWSERIAVAHDGLGLDLDGPVPAGWPLGEQV